MLLIIDVSSPHEDLRDLARQKVEGQKKSHAQIISVGERMERREKVFFFSYMEAHGASIPFSSISYAISFPDLPDHVTVNILHQVTALVTPSFVET